MFAAEKDDEISAEKYDRAKHDAPGMIPCYDPATMQYLGTMPAMTATEVWLVMERLAFWTVYLIDVQMANR